MSRPFKNPRPCDQSTLSFFPLILLLGFPLLALRGSTPKGLCSTVQNQRKCDLSSAIYTMQQKSPQLSLRLLSRSRLLAPHTLGTEFKPEEVLFVRNEFSSLEAVGLQHPTGNSMWSSSACVETEHLPGRGLDHQRGGRNSKGRRPGFK